MWSRHRNFSPSLPVEGSFCKISISKTIRGSKSRAAYTSSRSGAVATGPETLPLVMVPLLLSCFQAFGLRMLKFLRAPNVPLVKYNHRISITHRFRYVCVV